MPQPAAHDTVVSIPDTIVAQIRAHALERPDRECCGLLLGRDGQVTNIARCQNVSPTPAAAYQIHPRDYQRAERTAERLQAQVVGAYHSHPGAPAAPSQADRRNAHPGFAYVIVGGPGCAETVVWTR